MFTSEYAPQFTSQISYPIESLYHTTHTHTHTHTEPNNTIPEHFPDIPLHFSTLQSWMCAPAVVIGMRYSTTVLGYSYFLRIISNGFSSTLTCLPVPHSIVALWIRFYFSFFNHYVLWCLCFYKNLNTFNVNIFKNKDRNLDIFKFPAPSSISGTIIGSQ
jgi:hypothetical protein